MNSPYQPYQIDLQYGLSEQEQLVWQSAREFCERTCAPIIESHYENGTFPRELVQEFAEMGFLGASIPGYGCAGMNPTEYGLINLELERQDSGLRSFCSVQSALAMWPIYAYGSQEQRDRWLPEMAAGRAIGCFGLTEPNAGSNPAQMTTHAEQRVAGGDFRLNGQKMWITNSPIADLAIVWAKTRCFGETEAKIRGFIVERAMKGFSTPATKGKLSLRASITGEIVLEDVDVPASNLLPNVSGLKGPLGCLTQARYGIGWGALGAAMSVYERSLRYAVDRQQFSRPIAGYQLTQHKFVEMHNSILKGYLMARHFAELKSKGSLTPIQVSILKRDNVELALNAARTARGILGGNGIMGEYHIMRHLCNLETVYTYEGTHEIHTLSIGRALTGLSAFE